MTIASTSIASRRLHRLAHALLIDRRQDLAGSIESLAHLQPQVTRDQRLEGADHAVGIGPGAPPQFEHVAEAFCRDQAAARDLAFEQRIGRRRRAVHDEVDLGGILAGLLDRLEHALGLVAHRRRHLRQPDLAET